MKLITFVLCNYCRLSIFASKNYKTARESQKPTWRTKNSDLFAAWLFFEEVEHSPKNTWNWSPCVISWENSFFNKSFFWFHSFLGFFRFLSTLSQPGNMIHQFRLKVPLTTRRCPTRIRSKSISLTASKSGDLKQSPLPVPFARDIKKESENKAARISADPNVKSPRIVWESQWEAEKMLEAAGMQLFESRQFFPWLNLSDHHFGGGVKVSEMFTDSSAEHVGNFFYFYIVPIGLYQGKIPRWTPGSDPSWFIL